MSKPVALAIIVGLGLACATAGYLAVLAALPSDNGFAAAARPVWVETKWPFPIDQWGTGRAFDCKPTDCGTGVTLYLRAKVGFYNCETGVADDEESAGCDYQNGSTEPYSLSDEREQNYGYRSPTSWRSRR